MGVFRKRDKQGQAGDWVAPGQMTSDSAGPRWQPPRGWDPGQGAQPVQARLRAIHAAGPGDWVPGALRLTPGSMLWEPAPGINADPVELAAATMIPGPPAVPSRHGTPDLITSVQTPMGQFQIDLDQDLFEMTQDLVAEEAAKRAGPPADPGAFPPPTA